ncbi:MAG: TlpA family protein disulfide reductase [Flavobacteriaceae bacterium]|nr:MAG: TlpA family protein disulfide reductase [Flavobacteriaceae bacterium]
MKRLVVIMMVTFSIVACKNEPKVEYALLSGKIVNPKGQSAVIYKGQNKVAELNVAADGTFADTLTIETGYYTFVHGRENASIYLAQGNDLTMSLNTAKFDESITYVGNGAENNNYLVKKYLVDEKESGDFVAVYTMEENDFIAKLNAIKDAKKKVFDEATNLSDEFKELEKKNLEFEHLLNLQNYPSYHEYYAKKDGFEASKDLMKPLASIDYNNAEYYDELSNYRRLVQNHYANKIRESEAPSKVFDEVLANGFPKLKEDLSKMLNYEISPNNEYNEAYYKGLLAMSTDEAFKAKLTKKYEKVKLLAKGMPSPAFIDYENHKGGTMSLEDLRGKYVYVDVWATWCGPCKREIPYLKEVEQKYHEKNIAFVSTSIDKSKDHNVWVEMVKDKQLGGIQLFADNDWNSKFVTDYAIEGIPRFLLIDPEGQIVTADAPRPSDPKLIKMFEELKL